MTEVTKITSEELVHGVLNVAPDIVRIAPDSSFVCRQGVLLYADRSNGDVPVFVGGQGMNTSTGIPLYAGESIVIPIQDASRVFVCANESAKLYWMLL